MVDMNIECPHCKVLTNAELKAQPFQRSVVKTGFAVRVECFDCKRFIKFAKQTPEVLKELDVWVEYRKKNVSA